jgi:hypothetical protein
MLRNWLLRRFEGRAARAGKQAQRRGRGMYHRRPTFESLEPRLALTVIDITGTTLTVTPGAIEACAVGGDSLDGSSGTPLYFHAKDGVSELTLTGSAATYFTRSATEYTNDTATLKAGQTLDFLTSIVIANGDAGNPGYFFFGDGTYTLPNLGAAVTANSALALVTLQSNVTTTGYDQDYACPVRIIGSVTLSGADISFGDVINGYEGGSNDRLTIATTGALTFSDTIGQTTPLD